MQLFAKSPIQHPSCPKCHNCSNMKLGSCLLTPYITIHRRYKYPWYLERGERSRFPIQFDVLYIDFFSLIGEACDDISWTDISFLDHKMKQWLSEYVKQFLIYLLITKTTAGKMQLLKFPSRLTACEESFSHKSPNIEAHL